MNPARDLLTSYEAPEGVTLRLVVGGPATCSFDLRVGPEHYGQGRGTAALEDLCLAADECGVALSIRVEPDPGSWSVTGLGTWYARFGFVWTGPDTMLRSADRD